MNSRCSTDDIQLLLIGCPHIKQAHFVKAWEVTSSNDEVDPASTTSSVAGAPEHAMQVRVLTTVRLSDQLITSVFKRLNDIRLESPPYRPAERIQNIDRAEGKDRDSHSGHQPIGLSAP